MALSENTKRKFIESLKAGNIQVKTDTGWSKIEYLHKTVKYDVWELNTNSHSIKCADTHIVFRDTYEEVYVKDLNVGELILTQNGPEAVLSVSKIADPEHMFDLELDDENHRFYTNGILSHNSTTTRAYLLWYAIFHKGKRIAILANKEDLAKEQLELAKSSYVELPYWMQMGVETWNQREFLLGNGSRILARATSKDAIRGMTIHKLYCDEFAFVDDGIAEDFIRSVFPTISSGKKGERSMIITSCVTDDTYVYTSNGIQQIKDFVEPDHVLGYRIPEYKVAGYRDELNVGTIMHNDGEKETRIVTSKYGQLECSLEHKFWACKDGEYRIVRSKEFDTGDFICHRIGMNTWGNNDKIEKPYIPSDREKNIFAPDVITPDFAYFIGMFIAEGNMGNYTSGSYTIVNSSGDDLSNMYKSLNLSYTKYDDVHYKTISKSLYMTLVNIGFDPSLKAPKKTIPTSLLRMSKKNIAAMLSGIFDGDGYTHRNKRRVGISLSSPELIKQIRAILVNFGILCTYTESLTPPTERVKVSSMAYTLEINDTEFVKTFFEEISFRFDRKQVIFESFASTQFRSGRHDIIPHSYPILKTLKAKYKLPHHIVSFVGEHKGKLHFSRSKVLDIKYKLQEYDISLFDNADVQEFFENVDENIRWSPIINIDISKSHVYDFSLNDIAGDRWDHSVVYGGILGWQTPRGMNHFYKLWMKAQGGKGTFKTTEISWNDVPGRDEEWARLQIEEIGEIAFNQEFRCVDYNETVTIRTLSDGFVDTIPIGTLYDSLNVLDDENYTLHLNDNYEILTPNGFEDFIGVVKQPPTEGVVLTLDNGQAFECSHAHRLLSNGEFIYANMSLGKVIDNLCSTVISISNVETQKSYYDIVESDSNTFISSGIISHNCEFLGSDATLINSEYLTKMIKTASTIKPLNIRVEERLKEKIRVYATPIPEHVLKQNDWTYIASLDTGMGMKDDSTVMQLFLAKSNRNLHQVAVMSASDMNVRDFCKASLGLLKTFHNPPLIIEAGNPGDSAITIFKDVLMYDNLVHLDPTGRRLGVVPTNKSKGMAVVYTKAYIEKNLMKIVDDKTINELASFGKVGERKWKGKNGSHDDHVTSLIWIPYYVNSPQYWGNIDEEQLNNNVSLLEIPNDPVVAGNILTEDEARLLMQSGTYGNFGTEDEVTSDDLGSGYQIDVVEEDRDLE